MDDATGPAEDAALERLVHDALVVRNAAAIQELLTFSRRYLVEATARHRLHPTADPDSMAQHGVLRLLKQLPVLHRPTAAAFLGYLDRMAHNWAIDHERKRRVRDETSLGGESDGHGKTPPTSASTLHPVLAQERLEFLLSRCPTDEDRAMLRARFVDGLSFATIGEIFTPHKREDAVRMQITRLLVRLGQDERVRREWEA